MASYNVRLYLDTGFSPDNIPDSPTLLNSGSYIDIDAVWLYQNQEQGSIKISASFDSIYPVDYCRIGTGIQGHSSIAYYFVTGVNMLNPNTAQLNLQIDAITTIGLSNITDNLVGGWCVRRHVNNDALFSNNIEERFTPAEPLELDFTMFNSDPGKIIIASTLDLDNTELIAKTFVDAENSLSVTVPQLPSIAQGTTIQVFPSGTTVANYFEKTLPNIRLYDYNRFPEKYSQALSLLWSLGMIDSITSIYQISGGNIINYVSSDSGGIESIIYSGDTGTQIAIKVKWDYEAKNNKVFCDQFNKLTVASFCSGDELEYNPSDITQPNDTYFQFSYWHDPAPSGKTFVRPLTFQGLGVNNKAVFFQAVHGATWPNTQTSFDGKEGWSINRKLYSMNEQSLTLDGLFNLASGVSNLASSILGSQSASGPAGFAQGIANTVTGPIRSGINLDMQKRQNRINAVTSTSLTAPTIKFPNDNSLDDFIGNGFFFLRSRLSDNDSKRFDRYLTEYGYAVNEPLTKDCFYGRQYFNYVEATDINIKKISQVPMRLKQLAINQLEGGVRIWHTLVNAEAYTDNPIIGG